MVRLCGALLVLFFLFVVAGCGSSQGRRTSVGIKVEDPWIREPPAGADTAALYMKIINKGDVSEYLVSVETNISEKNKIHRTHVTSDGISHMEAISKLEIPPSRELVLKPGGIHVMLLGLKKEIKSGDEAEVILTFENLGDILVKVPVKKFNQ